MMINDMKKNELTEQEMSSVAGGFDSVDSFLLWQQTQRQLQKQEEARQKAMQYEAARQKAIRQAEEANQPSIHVHGGGASGGW